MPKFFAIFLCLCTLSLSAEIIETHSFKEVPSYVTEDTLLVLDIDDTLLIPVQMLGCDEWFKHRFATHMKNGLSPSLALDHSLAEWEAIRHLTQMEVVEKCTPQILKELQENCIHVIGLTTQGVALSHRTIRQLLSHHLDLSLTTPFRAAHYFEQNELGVLYRKGVLFTSGTSKGTALFTLCDHFGYTPKKVIFVNDKDTHLKDVEEEAERRGIEFVGLRYAYSDERKARFNAELAHIQFTNSGLHSILNDEEALQRKAQEISSLK